MVDFVFQVVNATSRPIYISPRNSYNSNFNNDFNNGYTSNYFDFLHENDIDGFVIVNILINKVRGIEKKRTT